MRALLPASLALLVAAACGGAPAPAPAPRIVIGAPEDMDVLPLLERLAPGVRLEGGQWQIGGHRSSAVGTLLVAVLDGPDGGRVTLGVAPDRAHLEHAREHLATGERPSLELWRFGERELTARLSAAGALRPETVEVHDLSLGTVVGEHDGVRYRRDPEVPDDAVHDYLDRARAAVERAAWAGITFPEPLGLVARGRLEPDRPLAHFDASSGMLFAVVTGAGDDGGRALVEALLRAELGRPGVSWWADACALAAVGELYGLSLSDWASLDRDSHLGRRARRARQWAFVRERNDPDVLRGMWVEPPTLDAAKVDLPPVAPVRRGLEPGWDVDAQLLRVHVPVQLGPRDGAPWRRSDVTLEGDAALLTQLWTAEAAGRRVAVEVVLVTSPSGTFDAERVQPHPLAWKEHLERRAGAVREVGLLAQLGGADLLVLGGSSPRALATRWAGEEEEPEMQAALREARAAGWPAVFEAARGVFHGPLGLASDLGRRAEEVGLWTEADVMLLRVRIPTGLDPVSLRGRARGGVSRVLELAERHGRPALVLAEGLDAGRQAALEAAASETDLAGLLLR